MLLLRGPLFQHGIFYLVLQLRKGREADILGQLIIELGEDLRLDLFEVNFKMDPLAGNLFVLIVVGKGNVYFKLLSLFFAEERGFELREEGVRSYLQSIPLRFSLLDRFSIQRSFEIYYNIIGRGDGMIVGERVQMSLLVPKPRQCFFNLFLGDLDLFPRKGETLIVGELDRRLDFDGGGEEEGGVFLHLDFLNRRELDRRESRLLDRSLIIIGNQLSDHILLDRRPELFFQQGHRNFAGTKTGDLRLLFQIGIGDGEFVRYHFLRDLDGEGFLNGCDLFDLNFHAAPFYKNFFILSSKALLVNRFEFHKTKKKEDKSSLDRSASHRQVPVAASGKNGWLSERLVREGGLEPPRDNPPDPKSGASAIPPLSQVTGGRLKTINRNIERIKSQSGKGRKKGWKRTAGVTKRPLKMITQKKGEDRH